MRESVRWLGRARRRGLPLGLSRPRSTANASLVGLLPPAGACGALWPPRARRAVDCRRGAQDPRWKPLHPLPNALPTTIGHGAVGAASTCCERARAMSVADTEDLAEAARADVDVVMEASVQTTPYEPARWRSLLGRLGAMRTMHVRLSFPFNRQGDIRENPALGGGHCGIGCYCLESSGSGSLGGPGDGQAVRAAKLDNGGPTPLRAAWWVRRWSFDGR